MRTHLKFTAIFNVLIAVEQTGNIWLCETGLHMLLRIIVHKSFLAAWQRALEVKLGKHVFNER
jgi:hypothetical protein